MSLSLLRTATAAAALTLAAASGAHAQESFAATDPIGATAEAAAPQGTVLKLDGAEAGASLHDFLATHHAGWLAEVRRLTPAEASERFGLDHGAGAILITTK
jgi:hypothetical protein